MQCGCSREEGIMMPFSCSPPTNLVVVVFPQTNYSFCYSKFALCTLLLTNSYHMSLRHFKSSVSLFVPEDLSCEQHKHLPRLFSNLK